MMSDFTLTSVRPWGGPAVDIAIDGAIIADIRPAMEPAPASNAVNGRGLLALPGFINAHAHVDKSWWGQPWVSYGGEAFKVRRPGRHSHYFARLRSRGARAEPQG